MTGRGYPSDVADLSPLEHQQLKLVASTNFWLRVRFEHVARWLAGRRTVIDIGAGSGHLGRFLEGGPVAYRFAETSPSLAAELRALFGDDAADDGGIIGSDDAVTLLDVVEHIEDDAGFLRSVADRMAPGALLIVTVPAVPWLFSTWDTDLGHFRRYRRSQLRDVVEAAGFDVVEVHHLFPELLPPALLRRFRRSDGTAAEFPSMPVVVDRTALVIGRVTTRLRRLWPIGTSLALVARRSTPAAHGGGSR